MNRQIINALLPSGQFWEPETGGDYDNLLDGMAANWNGLTAFLSELAYLRDPARTPILSDLEREYGIIPVTLSTEAQRRERLASFMFRRTKAYTAEALQLKLRDAGFADVFVHQNSPAVDPSFFLDESFSMTAGGTLPGGNEAQAGEPEAICQSLGGSLLVNGEVLENTPAYTNQCSSSDAWNPSHGIGLDDSPLCGDDVYAGDLDGYRVSSEKTDLYEVPANPGYWPMVFFVGGPALRDPVTGALTQIQLYNVPSQRKSEFRRTILMFKPLGTWCGLVVTYT
jgi:hypothetical protein